METTNELTRTVKEIDARIEELGKSPLADRHGIERSRLLEALPFADAQKWLVNDHPHTVETWTDKISTRESVLSEIVGYLPHAWSKANEKRGVSAQRSISHLKGLLWLLGKEHDELREWMGNDELVLFYGKASLKKVSELVGFDWRGADDDEWENYADGLDDEGNKQEVMTYTADEALERRVDE